MRVSPHAPAVSWDAIYNVVLMGGALVWFLWSSVPILVDSLEGSPPMAQMHRTSGWVKTWRNCYTLGRNTRFEDVTLVGDRATVTMTLPCLLPTDVLSDGRAHQMTVLTAPRRRLGTVVYDVALDGRTLLAYADVKRARDDPELGVLVPIFLLIVALFAMAMSRYLHERRARDAASQG